MGLEHDTAETRTGTWHTLTKKARGTHPLLMQGSLSDLQLWRMEVRRLGEAGKRTQMGVRTNGDTPESSRQQRRGSVPFNDGDDDELRKAMAGWYTCTQQVSTYPLHPEPKGREMAQSRIFDDSQKLWKVQKLQKIL